jgi:PAS domain S-box-containing protein
MDNADQGKVDTALRRDDLCSHALVTATADLLWTADANGLLTGYTTTGAQKSPETFHTLPGSGWLNAVHPDDRDRVASEWRAAMQHMTPVTIQYRVRTDSGTFRYMLMRGVPVIEDGRVTKWVGTYSDVHERVLAWQQHDELLEREQTARAEAERVKQQLHETLERVTDAFVSLDTNWHYVYVNHKAAQVFGRRPEDMIGKHIWTLFPEGVGQPFHLAYERAMAEQILIEIEEYYPPYDRWFENRIVPSPSGLSIYFQDITERKLAEIEARRDAARRNALAEFSHALTQAGLDYEAVLQLVARRVAELVGDGCFMGLVSEDGQMFTPVIGYHIDPAFQEAVDRLFGSFSVSMSVPILRPLVTGEPLFLPRVDSGSIPGYGEPHAAPIGERPRTHSLIVLPLRIQGRIIGGMRLSRDLTPDAYTSSDLQFAQELADRAALAIQNARLYKQAQEAIALREQFLSIAAHELKTPLTSLLGFTFMLQRRAANNPDLPERDRQAIRLINEQGERLNKLIRALLDVVRLQAGTFTLDLQPTDLRTVVRDVVTETQPTLAGHTLTFSDPDTPVPLTGDALRLEQVVRNLLQNAIKYSPRGGPIEVRVWQDETQAMLSVSDRGVGIPADAQPHLFDQFYRASNIDPRQIAGLGIGLYVVHEIVQRHGGTIEVHSVEGEGSTFTIRLPRSGGVQQYQMLV